MQTATTTQPGSYNSASQGFDRGSVPLVQRHASAGTAPGNGVENQGYTNLRQNAQRIPHPDDNHRGRSNRGRRDFHSWNNNRGQRMQSYTAQNYGFRHVSVGNEFQGDSCSTSSLSFNGSNYQQNVPQVVHSDSSITSQFNPGTPARNDQQRQLVHENMARTNQQQMPVTPVSVTDTNARHAFEDGLIQATLALQLENAGTPNGPGMDDITPRRPIIDNTVSATAPPKLGHQTPMLRSRRGQSVMGLNGSPVRRPSQPLTIDPIRGPPPAFFPQNTQSVTATSAVSSPVRSVSEVQNQTPASQSRATSVSVRGEEPHTAQAIMFSPDQLVTPNNQQIVRTQVAQVALPPLQIAPYQMAPNQMAPNQVTPWQIAPYQMPPLPTGPASRHLSIIAPGGKKPSIEVACDPQNLPFVELLRRAQPSNSNGVVRISNVSTPLCRYLYI
jgi:hypothetical protein